MKVNLVQINVQRLCRQLGYEFKLPALLKQALTHRSAGEKNNERLEFLGDSILNFVIANALFEAFPEHSEGELSPLRAYLVKGEMLAKIALELELGDCLHLGQGELKSGGFRRASILSDALEALFAAVFLDGGFAACQSTILKVYQSRLEDPQLFDNLKDPKTQLQEQLQAQKKPLPQYTMLKVDGDEHDQIFHVVCEVVGLKLRTEGTGDNRRKAEQEAAKKLLQLLKV